MTLTKAYRKKLARESRKLASEIVEQRAPLLNHRSWCFCALGEVAKRSIPKPKAGFYSDDPMWLAKDLARFVPIDAWLKQPGWDWEADLVSRGLNDHGPDGAVFPLLALADALEAA